mmetsp:Transcript_21710/g.69922  ORF Transcript_21710/g.69922 Transcript_21710/m.69922 type:complete len:502 (+) Transcript_21710:17-1522(+)
MEFERRYDTPAEVHTRFELKRRIGKGSYGTVYDAVDKLDKERIAIKCIERVFNTNTDALRTLRELSILRQCRHPNILHIKHIMIPPIHDFRDLWVVTPNCGWDLSRIVKHCDSVAGWSPLHIKFIIYQLLCALLYLQSANIIHRDLKPSNVLLNEACDVTLIDFGLARELSTTGTAAVREAAAALEPVAEAVAEDKRPAPATFAEIPAKPVRMHRQLTHHVVTRWYRAPELILLEDAYTEAVDMWSVGCIFGELLLTVEQHTGRVRPMFPGDGCYPLSDRRDYSDSEDDEDLMEELQQETHQLTRIFQVIGTPTEDEIERVQQHRFQRVLRRLPRKDPLDLRQRYPSADSASLELLRRMIMFDPRKRITVKEALASPFFADIRQPDKEITASEKMDFSYEGLPKLAHHRERERLRQLLLREVSFYNSGERKEAEGKTAEEGKEGKDAFFRHGSPPTGTAATATLATAATDGGAVHRPMMSDLDDNLFSNPAHKGDKKCTVQ